MIKERTAVLQHSYLGDRREDNKPDRLTRLGILAALEMYRGGEIDIICINVVPELSDSQVERYKMLLKNGLNDEDLIVEAETVSTAGEVKKFKQLADERGWEKLITIGNKVHLPRIKKEVKKTFGDREVTVMSAEEILSRYSRYLSILEDKEGWPEQRSLALQERILSTPILGELVLQLTPILSKQKVAIQTWVFKRIEKNNQ
ncbi:MAG: ElyC/SanA/YdcF family protein [Candidatus Woesebacteria bacterium]|jgi:hypothetical protein